MSVHCQTSGGRSPPVAEFHRQGSLTLEDALPKWNDPSGLRPSGFHCAIGGPRAKTEGHYHGVLAPNNRWRGRVTPANRGTGVKPIASTEVRSPAERYVAMSWARRLKRVFNIDRILAHLREKEQGRPNLSHLVPASRAPLDHYLFSQDANP